MSEKWDPIKAANNIIDLNIARGGKSPEPVENEYDEAEFDLNDSLNESESNEENSEPVKIKVFGKEFELNEGFYLDERTGIILVDGLPSIIVLEDEESNMIYITDNYRFYYKFERTANELFKQYKRISDIGKIYIDNIIRGRISYLSTSEDATEIYIESESISALLAKFEVINTPLFDELNILEYVDVMNAYVTRLFAGIVLCTVFNAVISGDHSVRDTSSDKQLKLFEDFVDRFLVDAVVFDMIDKDGVIPPNIDVIKLLLKNDLKDSFVPPIPMDKDKLNELLKASKLYPTEVPEEIKAELRAKGIPEEIINNMICIPKGVNEDFDNAMQVSLLDLFERLAEAQSDEEQSQ